jgi:hypothetical protein
MTEQKRFLLRIDPKLWEEINAWANQELRSVNGQIEFLLREAVRKRKQDKKSQNSDTEKTI